MKLTIILFLFAKENKLTAQPLLELKDNPKYIKNVSQLWQLKVSNMGGQILMVQINLELNDSAGQLLYTGTSRQQELAPGSRMIGRNDCLPISDEQMDVSAFPLKPGLYFLKFKMSDAGTNQVLYAGNITIDSRAVKSGLAALTHNKVRLGGNASIAGQQSDFSGINTEVPADYTRVMLNPTLTILEIPIAVNYLYSTENNPNRQPINQFSVQFDPYQYRANLEAKLLDKVAQVKQGKNPLDLKKLDELKSKLNEKSSKALAKEMDTTGNKVDLGKLQERLKEAENLNKVLSNPEMISQLDELTVLCEKYNIKSVEDIDKPGSKVPVKEREKLRKLFALKKQYETLSLKKKQLDELQSKYKTALAINQKMDKINKGDLGQSLQNTNNLQAGLKQFAMMGPLTKVLSSINTLAIGTTYPYFSEQTLNGARVDGFQVEMNPGYLYVNVAMGKSAIRAYESTFSRNIYTLDQELKAGKIGIGKKDATHIFFTGVQIRDKYDANIPPPDLRFTPRENYLSGTEVQLSLFNKSILLGAEANASLYNSNQLADSLPYNFIEKIGRRFPMDVEISKLMNASSKQGFAYKGFANILINKGTTNLIAKYSLVEQSYYTLGNEFLLRDRESIQLNANQALFKNKFNFSAYYEKNNNGLMPLSTLVKTIFTRYGGSIKINSRVVVLMVNYAPYFQSVTSISDSGNYTNTGEMINTSLLFKYKFSKKVQLQTLFGNTYQKLTGITKAAVSSFNFMQNLNSPLVGFQIAATYSPNQQIGTLTNNVVTANINGTLRLFKTWSHTIGYIYFDYQGLESKSGFYYLSQLPIGSHILIDISLSKNDYSNQLYPTSDFSEMYFRYGLKIQF